MADVHPHRAAPATDGIAGEVRSEPVQGLGGSGAARPYDDVRVRPWPDRHRDVDPASAQVAILLEGLFQEQVLPTADQQDRHLAAVECRRHPHPVPERVVDRWVLDP
jgi:hypothetical protein